MTGRTSYGLDEEAPSFTESVQGHVSSLMPLKDVTLSNLDHLKDLNDMNEFHIHNGV